MAYETIVLEKTDKVATITLNRPRVLNAISRQMMREIQLAVSDVKNDQNIKVLVFKGTGDRAFSAGIDVQEAVHDPTDPVSQGQLLHATFSSIRNLLKPVVCAVNGYCLGAGLEIMLSCDLAIATEVSRFSMPEINIGVVSIVEAVILSRAMSIFRAKEICLMGDYFDAQKAERCGLINEVVPVAKLEARVKEVTENLARKDANALAVQKGIINKWLTTDLEAAIDYSILANSLCHGTQGQKEGMASFLEKRQAKE